MTSAAPAGFRFAMAASTHAAQFAAIAYKGELEATVAEVAALGFDGIELAVRDPSLVRAEELVALTARHGLAVPAVSTGQAYGEEGLCLISADAGVRRAALDRLLAHLPLAAELDAVVIVGLIGTASRGGQTVDRATAHLVAALREATAAARDHGVRIAVEPVNRYEVELIRSVDEGLELIESVGAPNLGLLLDTFHMNIEEPSITGSIGACGERIFHFHVADSNRKWPGAGHIDFAAVLAELAATGYGGVVSGEFLPLPDAATAAKRFLEHMASLTTSTTPEGDRLGTVAERRAT
jgi:sugar phosphate isomerase/epimerase